MKILIPAIGSRGDVQPFISLCQGLIEAGHQVTLATNPTLVSFSYFLPPLMIVVTSRKTWTNGNYSYTSVG